MSRIGRMPVVIPAGVTVEIKDGNEVTIKGSKGTLTRTFVPEMKIYTQEVEKEIDEKVRQLCDEGNERMASYVTKSNYMIRRYAGIVHLLGETYNLQPTTIPLEEVE